METETITLGGGATAATPGSTSVCTHWLLRVGDGEHFVRSQPFQRWGVNSKHISWVPAFLRNVRPGDKLWFIQSGNRGKAIGVATFLRSETRVVGPLVAITPTDEELGWTKDEGEWDTEIHYTQLYDISACDVYTEIKSPLVGRKFNPDKCQVDLPETYQQIVRFIKAVAVSPST